MDIQLSDHFTYRRLFRFVIPSIIMMVFTSIYSVVDGFFISNYAGKTPFAAANLIMPFPMILGALGFMLGTGGSALVALNLGQGRKEHANKIFSFLVYVGLVLGCVLGILGAVFIEPIAKFLGADSEMLPYCVLYGRILLLSLPTFMMQNMFQSFLVTAEKPNLGLKITVIAGVTNMILDWLFMAVFAWGTAGAAIATAIAQCVGGIIPLIYFVRENDSVLRLGKTNFDKSVLFKTCTNGSSELVSNISMSVVSMLFNFQLMKYAGENGVAAYGVLMYVNFIFIAIFLGYSVGTAPIIGYHYGAKNNAELKNIFKKSMRILLAAGVVLTLSAVVLSTPLAKMFVGYDRELFEMTKRGFLIYSVSFLVCGFSIFGSSMFTALNDGLVSAAISFLRTFLFQIACVMVLPGFLGIDGIWLSVVVAEALSLVMTIGCIVKFRGKYGHC